MTVESPYGPAPLPAYSEPEAVIVTAAAPGRVNGAMNAFHDSDGPSFSDILDILNPLQHIPVINTIYQHITGDKEGVVADLIGGALWGGVIGLGAAIANMVVEGNTGKSLTDNAIALLSGDDGDTALAQNDHPLDQIAATPPAGRQDEAVTVTDLNDAGDRLAAADALPGGGPIRLGDFLVFGSRSGLAKAAPAVDPSSVVAGTGATGPVRSGEFLVFGQANATSDAGTPGRNGSPAVGSGAFMVFGAGQPAVEDLPAATAASLPTALTPAPAAPAPLAPQTAAMGAPPARSFPVPTQRNTVTPPQILPLPTTGPAAVPGNSRAISGARGTADQAGSAWFEGAFNQAMDKYNRAARLGTATPAAAQGMTEGGTAKDVLQMN